MNPVLIPILGDVLGRVLNKVLPDDSKKAEAQLELTRLAQAGEFKQLEVELQLAIGQTEINKLEIASNDNFSRRWRPFIGWVCGLGFAYQFVLRPLCVGFIGGDFPPLEIEGLVTLLFGMLGLGAYRTYEKVKVATR